MMTKRILPFLAFALLLTTGCKSKAPATGPAAQFEMKTFEKSDKPCNAQKDNCSTLHFQYPVFTKALSPAGQEALNRAVQSFILEPVFEKKTDSVEALSQDFFAENQKATKEFPEAPAKWSMNKTAQVLNNSPQVVSLSMDQDEYLGGAHPNSHLTYVNLNPSTGNPIKLSDLLIPGYETKLMAIAEKKFRELNQIAPNANLNDAGFFFKDGKFTLTDNFTIGPKSLTFYYNPYEIAPYAMGPITLPLDYKEISDLIKPDGVLASH